MKHTHDLIIIGAGIAGSAMALAASAQGLRIALLDKHQPIPITDEINLRVSNINYGSEKFLNTLGVFFPKERSGIFNHIKIFQENNANTLNFSADALNIPHLGCIIENNLLIDLIQKCLPTQQVNTYYHFSAEKFNVDERTTAVEIPNVGFISAPLMIGAEGAHSLLRQHCGIIQDEKPYQQTALVAHITTEKSHQQTAYQRFLMTGPIAYLPLHDPHQCSIVWSSAASHIDDLLQLDSQAFSNAVALAMQNELGQVKVISKRGSFPLVMRHAKQYIAPRIALIGDSIHTVHPLAGQGANLGLMDVACLAQVIKEARDKKRDYGAYAQLRPFERNRRLKNTLMLQAIQFFAAKEQPFVGLRSLGINWLERSSFLKRILIGFAQKP